MQLDGNALWPAVGYEFLPWVQDEAQVVSRRQSLRQRGPYRSAVVPKIANAVLNLDVSMLALADEAAVELSRFDSEVGVMIAPFASILLRSEASSSSQIENLTSSPAAIVRAELGLKETANSALIVSNQRAMTAAVSASSRFSRSTILNIHRVLLEESNPKHAGKFRKEPVWIGGHFSAPHDADYVAPNHQEVANLIDDLIEFSNRTDLPALVQVAIAHAQFETIHPFVDGNGRTGRALIQVLLHRLGLTNSIMVPVSSGLLKNTKEYFAALDTYRAGDPIPIINILAGASLRAVKNGRQLAAELEAVRMAWQVQLNSRADAGANLLLDHLLGQPVITSNRAMEILGRTAANTQLAIDKLVDVGILSQQGSAKRNRIWQADDVLLALENFAQRTRR